MQSKEETRKFRIPYVSLCTGCCGGREQQESIRGWEDVRSESFLEEVMVRMTVVTANLYKRLIMCQALFQTL